MWSMYPRAEAAYVPVCRALAEGLQEGDGGAHLITVHPDPSPASSNFLHGEPWLASNPPPQAEMVAEGTQEPRWPVNRVR